MIRITFYYIQRNLGHSRHVFSLIKNIKLHFKENVSIIVFQSGREKNPFPFKDYGKLYVLPSSNLKERFSLIIKTLKIFKPHIFITEFYPFGNDIWSFEVPYILDYIKKKLKSKIFASISYLMWSKDALGLLKEFYEGIFCHFPKTYLEVYLNSSEACKNGKILFRNILEEFPNRIYFTGYVLDKDLFLKSSQKLKEKFPDSQKKMILVSRGGGSKDKKAIIISSLFVAKKMKDYFFVIVTGPNTPEEEFLEYKKIAKSISNVRLCKYFSNFRDYLKACILSINEAGYNTTTEILWLKKKSVIIPYHTEEQRFRGYFLNKMYKLPVIFPEDLTLEKLREEIQKELRNDRIIPTRKDDFKGIENTIKMLSRL
jgi:predicted glycosyltransferase